MPWLGVRGICSSTRDLPPRSHADAEGDSSSLEKNFSNAAQTSGDMDRGDLPYDVHIKVGVIVGDDVSHPSHFPKRQFRNGALGLFVQVGGGFTDDFDPPDHRILFLRVGPEIRPVVSFTYDAIRRDAFRMSRNRPSWSASINSDRSGENMFASKAVGGSLERGT